MVFFSPITPEDRAFTRQALEDAEKAKGRPLTREERQDVLTQATNQLKSRYASSMCRAESAQADRHDAPFSWTPRRPFRR